MTIEKLKSQNEKQTRIYNKLHSIGKSLNEELSIDEVYDIATSFVTDELDFEKCLIFQHDDKNGWFKVIKSVGYNNPMEERILKIINLLHSGEVIEYLRVNGKPITHTQENPNEIVEKLVKSLFFSECYFELFGGTVEIPFGLLVVGNGLNSLENLTRIQADEMEMLALGNFTVQFSNTINNIVFYDAWKSEKNDLEKNIQIRTKEIEKQKKTFEAIYKTSKDGIAILDLETTAFLDVNPAYCDMTGYTKEELLRTSCLKLSVEEDKEYSRKAIGDVIEKGYITNFIKTCVTKNGERIIVNMSISLMDDKKSMLVSAKDITKQKAIEKEIDRAHNNIQASIKYASLIQHAILPHEDILGRYTKDSFVFWQPKDTVGGDIYFITELESKEEILAMVIDGAGHGVPGAFVTMLVKAIETQILADIAYGKLEPSPSKILEYFNKSIKTMLRQEKGSKSNAGFDGGVLYYNKTTKECKYAGSKTDLYIINDDKLSIIEGDRKSVGFVRTKINQKFKEHNVSLQENSKLYICTDGLYDQESFDGKRYDIETFEELILEINNKPFPEQKKIIVDEFESFKKNTEQSDDVTVLGIMI